MEPPPFGDGNLVIGGICRQTIQPSMEPPPFGDGNDHKSHEPYGPLFPFNGATALRRWKPVQGNRCQPCRRSLQWSHRPSAMETCRPSRAARSRSTFNGATALRRWKPLGQQGRAGVNALPSMEPPPFGDGNLGKQVDGQFPWVLQWSHRPSAMETGQPLVGRHTAYVPSMEPPPFGDGNNDRPPPPLENHPPSMEPPPFGDGNRPMADVFETEFRALQWSHRPSAMETAGTAG